MRKYLLFLVLIVSFNIAAKEIFLKCTYEIADNDPDHFRYGQWIKLTADTDKDSGSFERDNGFANRCEVTFTSSTIVWSCPLPGGYTDQTVVSRETLRWDFGKCNIIENKNKI